MKVLINNARQFAIESHGGQLYGEHPYEKHLTDVVQVLQQHSGDFYFPDRVFAAGWLHDVVEDTSAKLRHVYDLFGDDTGELVFAVTNENGRNRKEKTVKTMLKVREGGTLALAVKLADRIANSRFSKANGSPQFEMYKKEYPFIRWFLKTGRLPSFWNELDTLLL